MTTTFHRALRFGALTIACDPQKPTGERAQTDSFAFSAADLGKELAVPRHLNDGEEHDLSQRALLAHGELLFGAVWTPQEGGGRQSRSSRRRCRSRGA
jgi:hypothetical protein